MCWVCWDIGAGGYNNEMARDAVGNALVAGESASDIDTTRRDIGNTIELNIKPNVVDLSNMRRDSTDTTKMADLAAWKIALEIPAAGSGGGDDIVQRYSADAGGTIRTTTTRATINSVTLSDAQKHLRETGKWKIIHFLRVHFLFSSGRARMAIVPTSGGTSVAALATTDYQTLPSNGALTFDIDVPSTATDGYRVALEFDGVTANGTLDSQISISTISEVSAVTVPQ